MICSQTTILLEILGLNRPGSGATRCGAAFRGAFTSTCEVSSRSGARAIVVNQQVDYSHLIAGASSLFYLTM